MTLEPHSAGRSSRTQPRSDSQVAEPTRHLRMMGRGRHTPINDCNGAQCPTTGIGRTETDLRPEVRTLREHVRTPSAVLGSKASVLRSISSA